MTSAKTFPAAAPPKFASIGSSYFGIMLAVMAVVLMPPTLIASIYGMNFKMMPELEWAHGYPMALLMMLAAAVLPYFLFRWKKWL